LVQNLLMNDGTPERVRGRLQRKEVTAWAM
jgi:hypothetical protein